MSHYKAYKYRIYPNKRQRILFAQTFGCVRFVYNFFLTMKRQEYRMYYTSQSKNVCSGELTKLKHEDGYEWLCEVDSTALQSALDDLDKAYKHFFDGDGCFPRYKSKKERRDSYTAKNNNNAVELFKNAVKLPKVGFVKTRVSRPTEGRIINATVSKTPTGKYYVSVLCEVGDVEVNRDGEQHKLLGIDLGIATYATFSDGIEVPNHKNLDKALDKLAFEQQLLSRKTIGSKRYENQRQRVARIHEHIANIRRDFLQKLTTAIVMEYDVICIEDISVRELMETAKERGDHTRSRRIADASWAEFVRMLEYKCVWYHKTLVKVDRYYASSQICSFCGEKNPAVKDERLRKWTCPFCGAHHSRDLNAAGNILEEGLRLYQEACGLGIKEAIITPAVVKKAKELIAA